jgi:hypothetical protein
LAALSSLIGLTSRRPLMGEKSGIEAGVPGLLNIFSGEMLCQLCCSQGSLGFKLFTLVS